MEKLIQEYFSIHHKVSLSGIGSFSVEMKPASIDIADKLVLPPTPFVVFKENESFDNNSLLDFLQNNKRIEDGSAKEMLLNLEKNISEKLKNGETVILPGIGMLKKEGEEVKFRPVQYHDLFEPITAERVIRKNSEHIVTVGEQLRNSRQMQETLLNKETKPVRQRWWIGALILAAIGIGAIAFYYFRHR